MIGLIVFHVAMALLLTAGFIWLGKEPVSTGLRDQFPYGLDGSELAAGGAPYPVYGTITCVPNSWRLHGIDGPIGILMRATTERTGQHPIDEAALLKATRRLASMNPEPQELNAQAWARVGTFTLFEPAPRMWSSILLTIGVTGLAWWAAFSWLSASFRKVRAARAARLAGIGICAQCGYSLGGLAQGALCPECGGERTQAPRH